MPRILKRRSSKKQRGGRVSFPAEYFNPNAEGRYSENNASNKSAVSYGVVGENYVGPNHQPTINQSGGGLPIEYFDGHGASGRYFQEGSAELETCTSPYGILHPVSHGVILDSVDGSAIDPDGLSAGPNLAASLSPNMVNTHMTGGRRRKRRNRNRKSVRRKSSNRKSVRSKKRKSVRRKKRKSVRRKNLK